MTDFQTISAVILLTLLVAAAFTDIRARRIPNVIPACVVALFVVTAAMAPELREDWLWRLASFAIALGAGFALFTARVMGGGDVKLFAALALWHPLSELGALALMTGIAGAGVALFFAAIEFVQRRRQGQTGTPWLADLQASLKTRIPYGVAILIGQVALMLSAG